MRIVTVSGSLLLTLAITACAPTSRPVGEAAPVQAAPVQEVAAAAAPQAEAANFWQLDDVFHRAAYPGTPTGPDGKAIVCLGPQPETLDLRLAKSPDTPADAPTMLNYGEVSKRMGYPASGQAQDKSGVFELKLLVDERGRVMRHQFLSEGGAAEFRTKVEQYVYDLRFTPGKRNGNYAEWWVIVPFGKGITGC